MTAFPNLLNDITIAQQSGSFAGRILCSPTSSASWPVRSSWPCTCITWCVWLLLATRHGLKFFVVFEWVCKPECQGRGTPHLHIAARVICHGILERIACRTGTSDVSAFVKLLAAVCQCEIDTQVGNGRLDYINGYASKDHDAVDVGIG